jgi:hypothetical protein
MATAQSKQGRAPGVWGSSTAQATGPSTPPRRNCRQSKSATMPLLLAVACQGWLVHVGSTAASGLSWALGKLSKAATGLVGIHAAEEC